jgi:hypothetical protein
MAGMARPQHEKGVAGHFLPSAQIFCLKGQWGIVAAAAVGVCGDKHAVVLTKIWPRRKIAHGFLRLAC